MRVPFHAPKMNTIGIPVTLLYAILASVCVAAANDSPPEPGLIDCDMGKVAVFAGTESTDGRYATGWTIRVLRKDAKPVDWSLWTPDADAIRYNYIYDFKDGSNIPYEVLNYVVDLRQKNTIPLPAEEPFFPGRRNADLNAYWNSDANFPRCGLTQNESRFATENLWLIRIDNTGMSEVDLVKPLDQAVQKLLQSKMPINAAQFAISFPKSDWDENYSLPKFHSASVDIPFTANLPKSDFDSVKGTVTVHLPDGAILSLSSDTKPDDPFHHDLPLAKADRELNATYAALQRQLDPAKRAALKKEQVAWIEQRDSDAGVANYPIVGQDLDPSTVRHDRNASLLKSTLQRLKELKKRMTSDSGL